jgi:hypothetical protein
VRLGFEVAPVTDLSPLKDPPLREIWYEVRPGRDAASLRSIQTLHKINNQPVAEFWKEVDAKAHNKKP